MYSFKGTGNRMAYRRKKRENVERNAFEMGNFDQIDITDTDFSDTISYLTLCITTHKIYLFSLFYLFYLWRDCHRDLEYLPYLI